ncbi:hypothetical protein [Chryseobacterium koreense]|uniref:hypothetical protein n=1 Tax=Chryseobacterium koreense TaxID=232216 RepID=UPI0026F00AD3|nr:hypothetical protein [Chryseobacterium koreense]
MSAKKTLKEKPTVLIARIAAVTPQLRWESRWMRSMSGEPDRSWKVDKMLKLQKKSRQK